MSRPLRVLTWHVHGNYLLYLSRARVEFLLPVAPGRPGHGGRGDVFPFPDRVRDIPAESVRDAEFDCVLFQSRRNYLEDQHEILTDAQRALPRIYLEHDPPREHPTDTRHPAADDDLMIVHVTPFNALMWDSGPAESRTIEHGVFLAEDARATCELSRGIVVVNNLARRGRRLGRDVYEKLRGEVPLDLVGMDSPAMGGLGEIDPRELARFEARYRFFFNPIRYTSLGLAVIEAMMVGLPIVALATTEMATAVDDGVTGFLSNDPDALIAPTRALLGDRGLALEMGGRAREAARDRFSIERFASEWEATFATVAGRPVEGTRVAPRSELGSPR
ncbi:glycosyltransferase family 4 protein [Paludisphaera sp.]|uniref:glycosyltransferase n=1 Tax=Paludisphaera sp. TaxID=2017432 RepID=UPI00301D4600